MNDERKDFCSRICFLFLLTLQATEKCKDLQNLEYIQGNNGLEIVKAVFANGYTKKINITGNSGYAILIDILGELL